MSIQYRKNTIFHNCFKFNFRFSWYKLEIPKSFPSWACIHKLMRSHAQPQMLQNEPSSARAYPWATVPLDSHLLQQGRNNSHRCLGVSCSHADPSTGQSLRLEFTLEFHPVQYCSTETAAMPWTAASPGAWLLLSPKCSQAQQSDDEQNSSAQAAGLKATTTEH